MPGMSLETFDILLQPEKPSESPSIQRYCMWKFRFKYKVKVGAGGVRKAQSPSGFPVHWDSRGKMPKFVLFLPPVAISCTARSEKCNLSRTSDPPGSESPALRARAF